MTKTRRVLAQSTVGLLSLLAVVVVWEAALRVFFPTHTGGDAEGHHYYADASRLWSRKPNSWHVETHPDSGDSIPVVYNAFGMRQSREFGAEALRDATNVAFFGDSFVENIHIRSAHSFTESLDFLLNLRDGLAFNVLGFGVGGYGPGQQYVWYRQFEHRDELDHVVYVFHANDIEDFDRHGLFYLDGSGNLVASSAHRPGFWRPLLSRLHLTFMELENVENFRVWRVGTTDARAPKLSLLEVQQRVVRRRREGSAFSGDAVDDGIAAFQALLLHWKRDVETRGGRFHVALLPDVPGDWVRETIPAAIDVVDLHACFSDAIPNYGYYAVRFDEDQHWNEMGNMAAAHCLHRFLEEEEGLPPLSDDVLAEARYEYYRAVALGGWTPSSAWATRPAAMRHDPEAVRARYLALGPASELLRRADDSLVSARADWDVHRVEGVGAERDTLVYVKAACGEEDLAMRFFLHAVAADPRDLPPERRAYGYANLDFDFARHGGSWVDGRCVVGAELPAYEVAAVRAGQFGMDDGEIRQAWQVEIAADDGMLRLLRRAQESPVLARADWDVHRVEGVGGERDSLVYVKAACGEEDLAMRFSLHVVAADPEDLPPERRAYGYANLDFGFAERGGSRVDGRCVVGAELPAYGIAAVRTGQYGVDDGEIRQAWQVEIAADDGVLLLRRAEDSPVLARADWDVHRVEGVGGERDSLVYVKAACGEEDLTMRFFLHVVAADPEDLPPERRAYGYANLDFGFAERGGSWVGGRCVIGAELPAYGIAAVRTGQYSVDDGENRQAWQVEIAADEMR